MKACKKCRGLLVEALYGELNPEEKAFFENHLGSCSACASEFKKMTETLRTMDKRGRPDPGRDFWEGYWDRLVGRIGEERSVEETPRSRRKKIGHIWSLTPRWAFQAAAALALVVVGVFIGRMVFSPGRTPVDSARRVEPLPSGQPAADDPVLRARGYVDRSKLVLLALVNYNASTEDPYALNLPYQKKVSQELATQAAGLKSDLKNPDQRRLRELVTDLETILLQIANLESENDLEAVAFVKQGVENRGIFLKINLSEMGGDLSGSREQAGPEKSPVQNTTI
jgi:hypothetical protein